MTPSTAQASVTSVTRDPRGLRQVTADPVEVARALGASR